MTLHRLIPFFLLILNLVLLGSALGSDRKNSRNRSFAQLSVALVVWCLGVLGLRWSETPAMGLAWERFLHVGVVAIPILFYRFVVSLIGRPAHGTVLALGWVLSAFFMVVIMTPAFMTGVKHTPWGFAPAPGPLYGVFIVYFHAFMILGLVQLAVAHREMASSFRRNRIRVVIVGVLVGLLGGISDFVRFLFGLEWLYPLGIPANALFSMALGVAIVRYRLLALGLMTKRVVVWVLASVSLAPLLVVGLDFVVDLLWGAGATGRLADDLRLQAALLLGLLLGLPAMRKFEEALERLMFRRDRAVRDALVALSREMSETLDQERLARMLTEGLARRIPARHATLYVRRGAGGFAAVAHATGADAQEALPSVPSALELWMRATRSTILVDEIGLRGAPDSAEGALVRELERSGVALALPVFLDDELTAILLLGEKLSGEVFNPSEIELLEVLAARASTAIKNARLYEDLKAQMEEVRATRHLFSEAREADRAKERFIAILAHELRNPLAPILSAVELLERSSHGGSRGGELIRIIGRQAQHLTRLVEDLLDVSRVTSGKVVIRREPVDVRLVVRRCLDALAASGKSHGRDLRVSSASEPLIVEADPVRLQQVVWNLIDNALKYTSPEGAIRLVAEREGDQAVLRVRDTGIGLAPEALATVFELFTQAETSLQQAQGGLGVGLALVRSLVEQHGGSVTAHSSGVGHGSEFVVRLPVAPVAEETPSPSGPPPSALPPPTPRALRILLLEDNADARESLQALLEEVGHTVRTAADGRTGLRLALHWRPDIAVVDIGLPGLDGYEVARQLRRAQAGQAIALVALTGYGRPADRRRALDSGFDDHLVKPVDGDTLCRRLADLAPIRASFAREPRAQHPT